MDQSGEQMMDQISDADRARLRQLARQTNRRVLIAMIPAVLVVGFLIENLPPGASGAVVASAGLVGIGIALACSAPFRSFKAELGLSGAQVQEIIAAEKVKEKAGRRPRGRAGR
jgi:hypothetical protein